jgi:hypothetical protein
MPNFLVEETTVRHGGESPALSVEASGKSQLLLTLSISHVVERQNLDVDVLTSPDGLLWSSKPAASFLQKFCCGTYHVVLPDSQARFLKAVWRLSRWGHGSDRPLCRFSLAVEEARHLPRIAHRAMAGAA